MCNSAQFLHQLICYTRLRVWWGLFPEMIDLGYLLLSTPNGFTVCRFLIFQTNAGKVGMGGLFSKWNKTGNWQVKWTKPKKFSHCLNLYNFGKVRQGKMQKKNKNGKKFEFLPKKKIFLGFVRHDECQWASELFCYKMMNKFIKRKMLR